MDINYDQLPQHMREGARRYIEHGVEPGGFLRAVLANDLMGACARADHYNAAELVSWGRWLMQIPRHARGSYETVDYWVEEGGLAEGDK